MQAVYDFILTPVRWFESMKTSVQDRLVGAFLAVPSGAVLVTALSLSPDPSGMGTHQQLGLSGCAILTLSGFPCPMCGMTTTFTHLAHFQVVQGFVNQPFGLVLFLATVAAFAIGMSDLVRPTQRWRAALRWVEAREILVASVLLIGMFAGWGYKIAMVRDFLPWSP